MLILPLLVSLGESLGAKMRERRQTPTNCGQQVMLTKMQEGALHSPNYPGFFQDQNQCMWSLRSFDPHARIKIMFEDWIMPISASGGCETAYLEIRELDMNQNVQSSVKLCGRNPGFYISSGDSLTISLQGDSNSDVSADEPKRFALRVKLTLEPPRILAADGSFVVNGVSPLPKQLPVQPVLPPAAFQPPQPQPQAPPQPPPQPVQPIYQQPMGNYPTQQQQQPMLQAYPPSYPEQSAFPAYGQAGPEGFPAYPDQAVIKSSSDVMYDEYGQQIFNPYGLSPTYQAEQPPQRKPNCYPNCTSSKKIDPRGRIAVILLMVAIIVSAVLLLGFVAHKKHKAAKNGNTDGAKDNENQESKNEKLKEIQDKLRVKAIVMSEKVKENTIIAGEKLKTGTLKAKAQVREIRAKMRPPANQQTNTEN